MINPYPDLTLNHLTVPLTRAATTGLGGAEAFSVAVAAAAFSAAAGVVSAAGAGSAAAFGCSGVVGCSSDSAMVLIRGYDGIESFHEVTGALMVLLTLGDDDTDTLFFTKDTVCRTLG